jgi:hypothetical protein
VDSTGYGSCKIGEFVRFIENIGGNLVDRKKADDLVAEEGVELRNIFGQGYDFGHEVRMYWSSLL